MNRDVKKALTAHRRAERGNDERGEPVDQDFSKSEFEAALRKMKKAGAEGPDGIAPLFLQNLGDAGKDWLLDCCNRS